jgi:hypothetical protein
VDDLLETIKKIIEKVEPNASVVEFVPPAPEPEEDEGDAGTESGVILQ